MVTVAGASKLHHSVLRSLWNSNRNHWNSTCQANVTTVEDSGDGPLMREVNGIIQNRRRQHARTALRLDNVLSSHAAALHARAEKWQEERIRRRHEWDPDHGSDTEFGQISVDETTSSTAG